MTAALPTGSAPTFATKSGGDAIATPFMLVTISPTRTPAISAGEPGTICPTSTPPDWENLRDVLTRVGQDLYSDTHERFRRYGI